MNPKNIEEMILPIEFQRHEVNDWNFGLAQTSTEEKHIRADRTCGYMDVFMYKISVFAELQVDSRMSIGSPQRREVRKSAVEIIKSEIYGELEAKVRKLRVSIDYMSKAEVAASLDKILGEF